MSCTNFVWLVSSNFPRFFRCTATPFLYMHKYIKFHSHPIPPARTKLFHPPLENSDVIRASTIHAKRVYVGWRTIAQTAKKTKNISIFIRSSTPLSAPPPRAINNYKNSGFTGGDACRKFSFFRFATVRGIRGIFSPSSITLNLFPCVL